MGGGTPLIVNCSFGQFGGGRGAVPDLWCDEVWLHMFCIQFARRWIYISLLGTPVMQ